MEKEKLLQLVNEGLSSYQISKVLEKSQTTVRYWLKKYDLKTKHLSIKDKIPIKLETKCCPKCKETKPVSEFYNRRKKEGSSPYCKICTTIQVVDRQRRLKELAIKYKGGCCIKCGYNTFSGALEFHHLNPNEKDFTIAHLKQYSFKDKIKKELDKCILVCANCHREIHGGIIE